VGRCVVVNAWPVYVKIYNTVMVATSGLVDHVGSVLGQRGHAADGGQYDDEKNTFHNSICLDFQKNCLDFCRKITSTY
jgi:hypothetical protein